MRFFLDTEFDGPALPIDYPGVRDALRALAHAMCTTQARDPEQAAQLQQAALAHDALRYALGDKDPSGETGEPSAAIDLAAEWRAQARELVTPDPEAARERLSTGTPCTCDASIHIGPHYERTKGCRKAINAFGGGQ